MGAEEIIGYKVIDYVFAGLVLVAIIAAISIIFATETHEQLVASREIALMRDTTLLAPYQLTNASFSLNEEFLLKVNEADGKISVIKEDKGFSQEINRNKIARKSELISNPKPNSVSVMQRGEYNINVNV